jgi:hypothetical protein
MADSSRIVGRSEVILPRLATRLVSDPAEAFMRWVLVFLAPSVQFDLPDLRGSCVASTYSVEDGPKPVI